MSIAKNVLESIENNDGNLVLPKGISGVIHSYHSEEGKVMGNFISFKDGSELALGLGIKASRASYSDAGEVPDERLDLLFQKDKDFDTSQNC